VIAAAGYYLIRAASPTPSPCPSHSRSVPHPVHTAGGTPFSILNPTWIGALATAGLLIGAIVTAWYARKAFREQSKQVKLLQEQADRDIEQRRRAQAAKVFITVGGVPPHMPEEIRIFNTSEQPIYDLVAAYSGDNAELQRLPFLMPGEHRFMAGIQDAAGIMPPVWLDFRDAAGQHWRTTSRGELTEP
jgi:hypothetical protein